ncbi:MAG: CBS domain-containing protein [Methylococcales bacterium]
MSKKITEVTVRDYMAPNVIKLKRDMGLQEAIKLLLKNRITGAPVIDNHGRIIGAFSERNCLKAVVDSAFNRDVGGKVEDFMTKGVVPVEADMGIVDIAAKFIESTARNFTVVEDVEIIGVISRVDVLRAITEIREI